MKMTALRLFGFKTFAEQTLLTFEPGITAIVGPNGSGKSNLVDAIRWVLGEQSSKSLRTGKTEDIIFIGNDRRKPLGMAEVSVTFDNSDGFLKIEAPEVELTRRAYRAGESSEFFINRQQVRLRDMIELMMGTGLGPGSYSIVSQGQIDAILSSKPTERRSLFEETSGISKFLARKAESLRRLEQTEANGIRINDLLVEIQARLPELETQARRARRFRRASARLRDLEILSYLRASTSRRSERATLQVDLERLEVQRAAASANASAREAELSAVRSKLLEVELKLDALHAQSQERRAELAELETQRAALAARRDALEAQSSQITDDRTRAEAEQTELRARLVQLETELEPRSAALEAHRERERHAQEALTAARAALDRIFNSLREVEASAASHAASEAERRAQLHAAQGEYERLEREAYELRQEAETKSEGAAASAHELERAEAEFVEGERRLERAAAGAAEADARLGLALRALAAAQAAYRDATSELAGAEARLHTIEELEANLEGHAAGTRAVLDARAANGLGGIEGVVSDLIRVEERYARALDVAFGPSLSDIVTKSTADAERAIAHLRDNELGRARFLPLDALGARRGREADAVPKGAGVIGPAHSLVQTEARFSGIVAFLVGRVLVVESLAVAMRLAHSEGFRDTIVTLDGEEISGGGAMTGGRYKRESSILSRRAHARSLAERLPALRETLAQAQGAAEAAAAEVADVTRVRDEARTVEGAAAVALRGARSRVESLRDEHARLEREVGALLERAQERDAQTGAARGRLAVLERPAIDPTVALAERGRLEKALGAARETIARAQDAERTVAAEIATVREEVAALTARRDGARTRLELLDADRERAAGARAAVSDELTSLAARLVEGEATIASLREAVQTVDQSEKATRVEREELGGRANGLESDLQLARNAERDAAQASEGGRLRLAEIDAELGMLASQFAQNPATAEECADVENRYAKEEGDFTQDLQRLREELGRMQNVNLNAEAEITELIERERYLKEQIDDLARARETLLDSIREIEASSQEVFNETFEKVQRAFERVYARLFPGGEAKMWQTNPESLSETGIEISIQPPGKKMMPLTALSGGERAMAASALIFALIAVKPSPFYLLDEVDAALDEANIERFSGIVRELASEAQLIIVTHNKQTMELASRLYGVTMREPGISVIVGADLASVVAEPALAG
jgi:chromosome segregation protein